MSTEAATPVAVPQDDVIQEFVTGCEASYKAKTGKTMTSVGLDPISIITAILAVLSQMCPKPAAQLKSDAAAKQPGTVLAVRSATRKVIREQHPGQIFGYARFDGDAVADSVLSTFASKSEAKIQAGLDCCAM